MFTNRLWSARGNVEEEIQESLITFHLMLRFMQQRYYNLVSGTRTIREEISGMRKLRIIIPMVMAIVAVTAIGFSVALAQENERGDSNASRLAAKVAEILGLDGAEVDGAIKQAREELMDEAIQDRLQVAVENGDITPEQARARLGALRAAKAGKDAEPSWEAIQDRLQVAVENGDITPEQARARLRALEAAKTDKAAPP